MALLRQGTAEDVVSALGVARRLPDWFTSRGLEQMAIDLRSQPFLIAIDGEEVVGFVSYHVAEAIAWIGWMGVVPERHRGGIGRALVERLAAELEPTGVLAIRVDTLGDSVEYEPYARTRAFYSGVGFAEHARVRQDDPEWPDRLTLTRAPARHIPSLGPSRVDKEAAQG